MPLEDRHQLLPGAVLHHADEDSITSLMQTQDRDLATGSSASFASYPTCTEVALIDLDVSGKGLHLLEGHLDQALPQERVNAVDCSVVQPRQLGCREGWKIRCKEADHLPKSGLRNV